MDSEFNIFSYINYKNESNHEMMVEAIEIGCLESIGIANLLWNRHVNNSTIGHRHLQYSLACELYDAEDFDESFLWAKLAAEQGHVKSGILLAKHFASGQGVLQNDDFAKYWYEKSINNASTPEEKYEVGLFLVTYYHQHSEAYQDGISWIRDAAEGGCYPAIEYLIQIFLVDVSDEFVDAEIRRIKKLQNGVGAASLDKRFRQVATVAQNQIEKDVDANRKIQDLFDVIFNNTNDDGSKNLLSLKDDLEKLIGNPFAYMQLNKMRFGVYTGSVNQQSELAHEFYYEDEVEHKDWTRSAASLNDRNSMISSEDIGTLRRVIHLYGEDAEHDKNGVFAITELGRILVSTKNNKNMIEGLAMLRNSAERNLGDSSFFQLFLESLSSDALAKEVWRYSERLRLLEAHAKQRIDRNDVANFWVEDMLQLLIDHCINNPYHRDFSRALNRIDESDANAVHVDPLFNMYQDFQADENDEVLIKFANQGCTDAQFGVGMKHASLDMLFEASKKGHIQAQVKGYELFKKMTPYQQNEWLQGHKISMAALPFHPAHSLGRG